MFKLAQALAGVTGGKKLTLGSYLSNGPKAVNTVAADSTSVAKTLPTGNMNMGQYLSTTTVASKDATSVANTLPAGLKPISNVGGTSANLKFFGNTTALNKGKNNYYDNIDIYEMKIGDHTFRGQKDFLINLEKASNDAYASIGKHIFPSSGPISSYRTYDDQLAAWNRLHGKGAVADPNGKWANHMFGNAADLTGNDYAKFAPFLAKYDIYNGIPGDMHHFTYRPKKVKK